MPRYDYACANGHAIEVSCKVAEKPARTDCDVCGLAATPQLSPPVLMKVIVPDYPGAKARKAGYVHSHGYFPAEKLLVPGTALTGDSPEHKPSQLSQLSDRVVPGTAAPAASDASVASARSTAD